MADVQEIRLRNLHRWAYRTLNQSRRRGRPDSRKPRPGQRLRVVMPRLDDAVFVIGSPRSGTTFLGDCLGACPGISYHHEPVATKAAARYILDGTWSPPKAARFYRSVYRWLMRIHGEGHLRFAEKTPRNCFIVPFLSHTFPDARFLFIQRDGRDAALSHSKKPWLRADTADDPRYEPGGYPYGPSARFWVEPDRREEFETTTDLHRCIWAWRRYNEAALEGLGEVDPDRRLDVRYEELVQDPDGVGGAIADFLELEDDNEFMAAVRQARPDSVGGWRKQVPPRELQRMQDEAAAMLERLGYG